MLLTITCTATNASDLGYLLHKNPNTLFEKVLTFGSARVFYTEATAERCTAHLQVDVDAVGLARGKGDRNTTAPLAHYVSDRPYVPSSFLSVALGECFSTAMAGRSKERPERAEEKLPLSATLSAMDLSPRSVRELFGPLGYGLSLSESRPLDSRFPEWGMSGIHDLTLVGQVTVRELLNHLYVLVPVLDERKHYYIGEDEVEKLLRKGAGWLAQHPAREWIAQRYLVGRRGLAQTALARLTEVEETATPATTEERETIADAAEERLETPVRLNDQRIAATVAAIQTLDPPARRVIDLGCGEGKTLAAVLAAIPGLDKVSGMDVAVVPLERAARRLRTERMSEREREKVLLFQGSLVYRDARLIGYDVAMLNEVIEHLDEERLSTLVRVVFEYARPRAVIVTTPNAEYNSVWPSLPAGRFRHADHRFEWTRTEFAEWIGRVAATYGYAFTLSGVGPEDAAQGRGAPTQMALFQLPADSVVS